MENIYSRTETFIGKEAQTLLKNAKVAVLGLGGVGSYCLESLVRSGIGSFVIADGDEVSESNLNRQLIATASTVGMRKTDAAKKHILDILPSAHIDAYDVFINEKSDLSFLDGCDYVADALDTISAKLAVIQYCKSMSIPLISAMGAGNKTDPMGFNVADIYDTSVCPLCRVMRKELRARNIGSLKVVYSTEEPRIVLQGRNDNGRNLPASLPFVPGGMGLLMAKEIFFGIIGDKYEK